MKKLKQILFLLLAINVFALANTEKEIKETVPIKNNKNITNNKKIATNYELLSDILGKRSRELKDLRLQSDYIITRENLEWQVFFSGFWGENHRGGHKNNTPFVINQEDSIKSINLGKTITVRVVNDINLNPEINIEAKVIAEAPHIVIPNITLPSLNVTAPNLNINPNVISPNIDVNTNVYVPQVALSPITVVSFGLPFFNTVDSSLSYIFNNQPANNYSKILNAGDTQQSILTLYGATTTRNNVTNNGGTLTVAKSNTRGMEVDEPIDRNLSINNRGTINLSESMTVGMEARGARIISTTDLSNHNTFLYNEGNIIGNAKADGSFINQAALSIGLDDSVAGTRVQMINTATGNITMNAPQSIGIQLRPDQNLIVQQGYNEGTITINGYRSYGMVTNPGNGAGFLNQDSTLPNETSRLSLTATGTINVNGDESTGFAILVGINEWGGDGTINVGTVNPNQDPLNGDLHGNTQLVQRATGLFSNQPIINVPCISNPTGFCGSGGISRTGIITVGANAYESSAVRIEGLGEIGNAGTINVTGNNNYGAVVTGKYFSNHIWTPGGDIGRMYINSNNSVGIFVNGDSNVYGENKSLLNVNGNNSVGILVNNGVAGNLGQTSNVADYWRGNGTIETTGNSNAVILTNQNTALGTTFSNTGVIKNNSEGTIGIYADKGAFFNHFLDGMDSYSQTARIVSGDGAIGIYAKDNGTIGYISAPVQVGNGTALNTAIGVMSDGNSSIIFTNTGAGTQTQASLNIGNNAVGLYSIDSSKFSNTFQINGLRANIGQNSVLGYIKESTVNISNLSSVTLDSMGINSTVLYGANNSDITIDSNINVPLVANAQLFVAENSKVTLNNGIVITGLNTGLSAFSLNNKFFSDGTPIVVDNNKTGVTNKGTVTMNSANSVGMYTLYGQNINEVNGIVNIQGNTGVGMYSEEEANINNKGTINLNNVDAVGIYAKGDSGKSYSLLDNINVTNTGTINLNSAGNIGIAVNNNKAGSIIADSVINNTGDINIIGNDSIGIYAPKSTVNTGNIKLTGDNTIGVYASNGTEITSNHIIDLGTNNQLQTAYYLTDTSKVLNLGDIKGYGIAVYSKDITIDDTFATIDLTGTSDLGAGKVGLVLSGTSNFNYTKDIKVGDSAGNNYSVALYTDNQNLSSGIANNLFAGANGVGLYAQNGSNIKYSGTINTGDGTTAGTGIYIGTTGLNTSIVDLEGVINLNGTGGIGAYVDNGSTFNFNSTGTMNFYGDGVALFGNAGAIINDNGGVINTNGHNVERTRIANGTINIIADTNITDNNILGHVVNGEMNVLSGITVKATGDKIIGVYADGLKGAGTWSHTYEANNLGTLDFTNATNSTAMYLDNARGQNTGLIKVGTDSLGMYGVNNAELYNNSIIEIGNKAVGMYGKNSKIENNQDIITKADESIGIYGITSNIENLGNINLNNNSNVGIYGDSSNVINTNTINLNGEKSVGIYGENSSNIQNNQDIFLGNSASINTANTGIYSSNSNAVNTGDIIGGDNTIGVYNTGQFDNLGNIQLGTGAVGVYSDGGTATIHAGSKIEAGEVALLVKNGTVVNNSTDVKGNFIGYAGINGKLINNANLNVEETGFYSNLGEIENNGIITASNNEAIFFYGDNAKITNNADIIGSGVGNIGIYGVDSVINNIGNITVTDSQINSITNSKLNKYAVGIYGKNSSINNTGNIEVGANAIGIYANKGTVINTGNITANKNDSVGIFLDRANAVNGGIITMNGDNSTGIYLQENSSLTNTGTININGKNSTGIYMYDKYSTLINTGVINLNGDNSIGIITPENVEYTAGTINANGTNTSATGVSSIKYYDKPTIVNAGQINVAGNFDTTGLNIIVKPDPTNISQTINKTGDTVSLIANSINVAGNLTGNGNIYIASDFSKGTNFETYILEDVINAGSFSGLDSGEIKLGSKSVTWETVPVKNADGTTDIYMSKIAYDKLSKNLWFNEFAKNLDSKYLGATGNALKLFDEIDALESESDFRHAFGSLGGSIYANMNQREKDIAGVFENSLDLLQDSKNNTKENVKVNIITGKSSTNENTDGIIGYDSTTVGVLALREVERTYKHKFGYSIGYTHTNFEFKDGNNSEELADTIQLGVHNKYRIKNDYILRNDLTGRVSFYNIDRNVDWGTSKSELNGHYETYSITLDNSFGKEIELDNNNTLTPYAGIKLGYLVRPGFTEKGLESLQVQGSDAWNVKPQVGIEFKTSTNELKGGWKLKGTLDLSYGYELVDSNTENTKLTAIENNYHDLATPRDENGTLKTRAIIGAEIEDRYGIFLTGEYLTGNSSKNDYKAGVTLKAVF